MSWYVLALLFAIIAETLQVVKCKKSGENKKAKALWVLKAARDKGCDCHDAGHAKKIQTRSQVRLDLWTIHLQSPTAAVAKTLEGLEQDKRVPSVTSEW